MPSSWRRPRRRHRDCAHVGTRSARRVALAGAVDIDAVGGDVVAAAATIEGVVSRHRGTTSSMRASSARPCGRSARRARLVHGPRTDGDNPNAKRTVMELSTAPASIGSNPSAPTSSSDGALGVRVSRRLPAGRSDRAIRPAFRVRGGVVEARRLGGARTSWVGSRPGMRVEIRGRAALTSARRSTVRSSRGRFSATAMNCASAWPPAAATRSGRRRRPRPARCGRGRHDPWQHPTAHLGLSAGEQECGALVEASSFGAYDPGLFKRGYATRPELSLALDVPDELRRSPNARRRSSAISTPRATSPTGRRIDLTPPALAAHAKSLAGRHLTSPHTAATGSRRRAWAPSPPSRGRVPRTRS